MFIGELEYERVEGKESFVGRPVYRLTKYLAYKCEKHPFYPDYQIQCDVGFETDFASIPEWIIFLNPKNGKWKKASVIHDKACLVASKRTTGLNYKDADLLFYYAMRDDGASRFTANFLYFWVRLNHIVVGKE